MSAAFAAVVARYKKAPLLGMVLAIYLIVFGPAFVALLLALLIR